MCSLAAWWGTHVVRWWRGGLDRHATRLDVRAARTPSVINARTDAVAERRLDGRSIAFAYQQLPGTAHPNPRRVDVLGARPDANGGTERVSVDRGSSSAVRTAIIRCKVKTGPMNSGSSRPAGQSGLLRAISRHHGQVDPALLGMLHGDVCVGRRCRCFAASRRTFWLGRRSE